MKISINAIPSKVIRIKEIDTSGKERGRALEIQWSTGEEISYRSDLLRRYCPCADCLIEQKKPKQPRSRLNVVTASEEDAIDIKKVTAIGNYALGILWGDGHNAGIYTYSRLKELADIVKFKTS